MIFSSFDQALSRARELDAQKDWVALEVLSREISAQYPEKAEGWLLHALSMQRLDKSVSALDSVRRGLERSPQSNWGLNLAIAIYRSLGRHADCRDLVERLTTLPSVNAENFATITEYFAECGDWEAAAINSARRRDSLYAARPEHSARVLGRQRLTIVVQAFARADRVNALLDSLMCAIGREECNLIICVDSAVNSRDPAKYSSANKEVINSLGLRAASLVESFHSVCLSVNPVNLSTALTAQRACDLGFDLSDNVIFFEEDCIVAPGVLRWFKFGLDQVRNGNEYWFVGGESPFFNSEGKEVSDEIFVSAQQLANTPSIRMSYVEENYVPSTCFATTAEIWAKTRAVRGLPRGAEHITTFLRENQKKTIFPSVPFVKDVGMQDALGYSVANLGTAGVKEIKTVYLMNDCVDGDFVPACFDTEALYAVSTNLNFAYSEKLLKSLVPTPLG